MSAAEPTEHELASIGVVIVSHQSASTLARALDPLPIAELGGVVVVDNASTDGSAEVAAQTAGVVVVRLEDNVGFGRGVNRAIAALPASVEKVLVLNPDATLDTDALRTLGRWLDDHPSCAVAGPRLRSGDEPITSAGRRPTVATEVRVVAPAPIARRLPDRRHPPGFATPGPVGYVEGACFLLRRRAFDEVGGFDPRYFLFYEEQDLARRLAARGWTVDLCPTANAHHEGGASRATLSDRGRSHLERSAALYLRRWHGVWASVAYQAAAGTTRTIRRRR